MKQNKSAKTQPMTEMEIIIKGETFPVDANIPGDSCSLHYLSFLLVVQNGNYIQFNICAVDHSINQMAALFYIYVVNIMFSYIQLLSYLFELNLELFILQGRALKI